MSEAASRKRMRASGLMDRLAFPGRAKLMPTAASVVTPSTCFTCMSCGCLGEREDATIGPLGRGSRGETAFSL